MSDEIEHLASIPSDNQPEDKDQKLAYFQELTHLDDFDQCQAILESTNWDLDQAIQSYFSGATLTSSATSTENQIPNELDLPAETRNHIQEFQTFTHHLNQLHQLNHMDTSIDPFTTSSSPPSKRLLTFNIEYLNHKFTLHIPDNELVFKIKELIEERLNIPANFLKLNGWLNKSMYINDKMKLNELNLPLETSLYALNTSEIEADVLKLNPQTSSMSSDSESQTFELYIQIINPKSQITIINQSSTFAFEKSTNNETTNEENKFFRLNFDSTIKFIDIRRTLAKLTNIIANDQEWWYFKGDQFDEIKSATSLGAYHRLIESDKLFSIQLNSLVENSASLEQIKKILDDLNNTKNSKLTPLSGSSTSLSSIKLGFVVTVKPNEDFISPNPFESLINDKTSSLSEPHANEDLEEYEDDNHMTNDEDLDENFLSETVSKTNKQKPLLPADSELGNELACTHTFAENFSARYGPVTPLFFIGKLEDAIREALLCPARDRKLLGIYLHSDHTIFHNIFCSRTLCDENVVNFLSSNFVIWPWDLTLKQNEQYFYEKCSKHLGSVFTSSLKNLKEKLPVFLVVTRVRASNEVTAIIEGDSTNETMMNRLMQTFEMSEMQRVKDEGDERTRDEREKIKREQDVAYQASLEFDKAKRQRQDEENERLKHEAEISAEMERRKVEEVNTRKTNALNNLPMEPSEAVPVNKTSRIRFRLPTGEFVQRKFFIGDKLRALVDFVTSHGYFAEEYKLLSSWPRKDLTSENLECSLEEMKLFPQETLTLEQR